MPPMSSYRPFHQPTPHSDSNDLGVVARAWAVRILFRWLKNGEFPDTNFDRMGVPPEVRGFTTDLVYTTIRWHGLLDAALKLLIERRPSWDAEAAIVLGLCQLLKMPDIPAYAAIHATVEAAKVVGNRRTPIGLINAALRNADKFHRDLEEELAKAPLNVRVSHPADLVRRWAETWGVERAEAICRWDNEPADVVLVTLPGGPSAPEIAASLVADGIATEPLADFPGTALRLSHGHRVEELPGFQKGEFTVQDPSTLAAVDLLDVRPGLRILDACAAPGGKAARIARTMAGEGQLVAMELHEDRLRSLETTIRRLVPEMDAFVEVRAGDASQATADALGGAFDRILLDVPCSNTGVLRRRVDARWRLDPERLSKVRVSQRFILDNAANLLAPGGRIVYSTCSIDPRENAEQIDAFLANHPDFHLVESRLNLPGEHGADGSFAAALERGL